MFKNTINALRELGQTKSYSMKILPDNAGFIDKECPSDECLSKFKVNADDWKDLFCDDAVYCPFCGFSADADRWWTTEQVNQAREQAKQMVTSIISEALDKDAHEWNRRQPKKSFIQVKMKHTGRHYFVNLPAAALEEMEQQIQCEFCNARYAVIGSAFYCPCCGKNSAKQTFFNSINKVKAKINNIDRIRDSISETSKDEAARTCDSLIESSVSDLVVAFQRLCECLFQNHFPSVITRRNVFQNLDEGNALWKAETGEGYDDWLDEEHLSILRRCFQQRHLLQHAEGIVDQTYIDRSGDLRYAVGQRLIIDVNDILSYARIVEFLGDKVISIV